MLKIGDYCLIALLVLGMFASLFTKYFLQTPGEWLVVEVAGQEERRVKLTHNESFTIRGKIGDTTIVIQDKKAWITESPCPFHVCEHMGKIEYQGSMVVCVPNQVLIRITGHDENQLDGITR